MNIFIKQGFDLVGKQIKEKGEKVEELRKKLSEVVEGVCNLRGNFDYEELKRVLELERGELDKLVFSLKDVKIIEIQKNEQIKKILIGSSILVQMGGNQKEYTIGAYGESFPEENLISYFSPLGSQLINMKKGEKKKITLGDKEVEVEIIKIFPPSYKYKNLIKNFYKV